ncbi:MAG: hypothetical protein ACYDHX_10065 [Methanothrix sp.]
MHLVDDDGNKRDLVAIEIKRVDKTGRIYVDKSLIDQELLFAVAKPTLEDRGRYLKVGRRRG